MVFDSKMQISSEAFCFCMSKLYGIENQTDMEGKPLDKTTNLVDLTKLTKPHPI